MGGEHGFGADAAFLHHAGAEVLDQDIGALAQLVQGGDILGLFQVQRDGALGSVLAVEIQRGHAIRPVGRAPEPCIIAAIGFFHLDDVGTHIGQHGAGKRAGQRLADLDDGQAGEG